MNSLSIKKETLVTITQVLYVIYFVSFIFCFRAITSISIGILLLTGIITKRESFVISLKKNPALLLIIGCTLFYLMQFISLFYTPVNEYGWNKIFMKSGIVFIPVSVYLNQNFRHKLLLYYCMILFIASLYCLSIAGWKYSQTTDTAFFFYHTLVSPLSQHAVYFSIYVFVALLFLLETTKKENKDRSKIARVLMIIFFSGFLFLLSSKFVISTYLLYLISYFIQYFRHHKKKRSFLIGIIVLATVMASSVLIIRNPVSNRFYEIMNSDISLINQKRFDPGDYFNGLQFRLLQWKFVNEILTEKKNWWTGVGTVNAQSILDQKYISKNMYLGDASGKDHGYIGYNTHNQFLGSLLETGIPGLIVFIFICVTLIRLSLINKSKLHWFVTILLILYAFIESIFETQYGISLFLFFPLLLDTSHNIYSPHK